MVYRDHAGAEVLQHVGRFEAHLADLRGQRLALGSHDGDPARDIGGDRSDGDEDAELKPDARG